MKNKLGKRIKQLREEKELSQLQLAKILNISNSTLSQYEAGNRVPSDDVKSKIAKIFDTTIDYLVGNSDVKNPYKDKPSLPEEFTSPEEAIKFILNQNVIMGFGGFDVNTMSDEEVLEFANELLNQLRILSYKYKR